MAVARGEQPSKARQIIKDPTYLEFLRLKREAAYYEKAFLERELKYNLKEIS